MRMVFNTYSTEDVLLIQLGICSCWSSSVFRGLPETFMSVPIASDVVISVAVYSFKDPSTGLSWPSYLQYW